MHLKAAHLRVVKLSFAGDCSSLERIHAATSGMVVTAASAARLHGSSPGSSEEVQAVG